MIRFQQTFGAHTGRVRELDQDVITFGRLPGSDVAFDPNADLDASGRHAEVRREGGAWVLVDVGSRNGTWLNGNRVERAPLAHGDEIEFGLGGPRVRVELVGGARPHHPSAPQLARHDQRTAAATPVPPDLGNWVDASGPTLVAQTGSVGSGVPSTDPPATDPHSLPVSPSPASWSPASWSPASSGPPGPTSPNPAASGPAKRYGEKTVGMMIQDAMRHAQAQQGSSRSTAFLRAIAHEAAGHSSRGLKLAVAVLFLLFVLAVLGLVALFLFSQREVADVRRRSERLHAELQRGSPGGRIAAAYEQALYMLVERGADGSERGICSAFAVQSDVLGTGAHCVVAMERGTARGLSYVALANGGQGERVAVTHFQRHSAYTPGGTMPSADVGLVRIAHATPVQVVLATPERIRGLRAGDDVFVYGFPGDLSDVRSPVATITGGVIGRMVAFDGTAADPELAQLIQHNAFTSPGTSGSPVFDRDGAVIAVNAGTYRQTREQEVVGPGGAQSQTVVTESGYKYGVRADLLAGLLTAL